MAGITIEGRDIAAMKTGPGRLRLALFGATGRTGSQVLAQALEAGHAVRALAREPAALGDRPGLTVVQGDVLDPAAVAETIRGADAVLSALGGGDVKNPGVTRAEGMRRIAAAMRALGVRRVVALAGAGILDAPEGGLRQDRPTFPAVFRPVSEQHRLAWEALRDSDLDWTMVCTGDLIEGPRDGQYRAELDRYPEGARNRIAMANVAEFMLRIAGSGAHLRRRVGLAG